jgi:hypothetical protein
VSPGSSASHDPIQFLWDQRSTEAGLHHRPKYATKAMILRHR